MNPLFLFFNSTTFFELYSFTFVFKVWGQLRDAGARLSSSLDWLVTLRTCGEVLPFFISKTKTNTRTSLTFLTETNGFILVLHTPLKEFHSLPRTLAHPRPAPILNSLLPPFVTLLLSPDLVRQAGRKPGEVWEEGIESKRAARI